MPETKQATGARGSVHRLGARAARLLRFAAMHQMPAFEDEHELFQCDPAVGRELPSTEASHRPFFRHSGDEWGWQ